MTSHLAVIIVAQAQHKVVAAQPVAIVASGPLQMDVEGDAMLLAKILVLMNAMIQQNLHLAQIVVQIAVPDAQRIAKMIAITLPNHPHVLVVAIAVIVPVLRIAMIHVELDVTLHARGNVQVLV